MKGVIFNVVQEVVEETFGADVWDDAIELAGVHGAYTSLGSYDDADLLALVGPLAEIARVSRDDVLVLAGQKGFRHLASRHVELLVGLEGWRDVVERLDGIIHPEVKKIYPDADVPYFGTEFGADDVLLEYRSARNLCSLAEGLALGLGDWFETPLSVTHVTCVHRGDDGCRMAVTEQPSPA